MTTAPQPLRLTAAPELSPLGVVGFSAQEESVYRTVLRNSGGLLSELAVLAGLPVAEMRDHLAKLAGAGLVDLRGDRVVAHAPQEALARLVDAESRRVQTRHQQLNAVRDLMPSLSADHLASSLPEGTQVTIQVVEGGDIVHLVRQLSSASSGDLLWLRPDPWTVAPGREIDDWVIELMRSGRRSRAVYGVEVLRRAPEIVQARAEAGEVVRIMGRVPTRMAVLGGTAALIAEKFGVVNDRRLVLRQHSMVAALTLMFEGVWERATPVPGLSGEKDEGHDDRRQLLAQLAGGAKDEQVARALGLSVRTVRRRVADLLDQLGAESRFAAGVEAARRGWL